MSMNKMVRQMAFASAAAKGVQMFQQAGGIDGIRRKLSNFGTSGKGGLAGMLGEFGIDDRGRSGKPDISGLLGGLAGASGGAAASQRMRGLLDTTRDTPADTPEEEQVSGLMIRAMIQAARADGEIDAAEREVLMEAIGEADPQETAFIEAQMAAPVDPEALARDVPEGHELEIYTASVIAIEPDNRAEARHLDALASALKIDRKTVNAIHDAQGKPPLYTL
jgi:uncharacterized membrane protein YebE (DUF533 family)